MSKFLTAVVVVVALCCVPSEARADDPHIYGFNACQTSYLTWSFYGYIDGVAPWDVMIRIDGEIGEYWVEVWEDGYFELSCWVEPGTACIVRAQGFTWFETQSNIAWTAIFP